MVPIHRLIVPTKRMGEHFLVNYLNTSVTEDAPRIAQKFDRQRAEEAREGVGGSLTV